MKNEHKQLTIIKLLALIYLQILDLISTLIFLKLGVPEANWLVTSADDPTERMYELKFIFIAYTLLVSYYKHKSETYHQVMNGVLVFYTLAVSWNLYIIMRVMNVM